MRRFGWSYSSIEIKKHLKDVMAKMEHDEIGPQLFRDYMRLVTQDPASSGGFQQPQALDN